MRKFKVAVVQMNALKGKLEHNIEVHRVFAERAARAGARLVMFPELSVTAHFGDDTATALAEPVTEGRIFAEMSALAKRLKIVIGYGFAEAAHGTFYNSFALVGPDGLMGVQRKVHASRDEYFYFRMGRSLDVFDLGFCRVGVLVCYDAAFHEGWRSLALMGADVLLLPQASRSGWGKRIPVARQKKDLGQWLKSLPGKHGVFAADNAVFAASANQAGFNGHSTHSGGACIVGPHGKVLAHSRASIDDLMVTADLDPVLQTKARNAPGCTLRLRRPEIYSELTRMI